MKKIGIIDADLLDNGTRHPNLALMKISGYHKDLGHDVLLLSSYDDIEYYDTVFVSKVFTFTKSPDWIKDDPKVKFGGTGFFPCGDDFLPDEIEHHMPDYTLYHDFVQTKINNGSSRQKYSDYLDYSIGFATRGCFRKCDFCVNKKYDHVFKHSPINEFLDEQKPYIYLWDDNFLGYPHWEKVLDELENTKKPFQFRQGLDMRLMTDKIAKRLSNTRYHGDFIFAFDHLEDRTIIEKKLRLWRRHTNKTTKLYVLCAFNSQDEHDIENAFERIKILMLYGCLPYIMRYEDYKKSEYRSLYTQLARWCNQPQFFKKKSFRQFCEANQDYHRNSETTCSAFQSMLDFERDHPDIAKRYFDLRFDQENQYSLSYGYERKYAHKQDCDECKSEQKMWVDAYNGKINRDKILLDYFTKEIDLQCLTYRDIKCKDVPQDKIAAWFCDMLLETELTEIIEILKKHNVSETILPSNIPQYSKLTDALHCIVEILVNSGLDNITFDDMGYYLEGKQKNKVAQKKYGENHAKFAALIDLVVIYDPGNANNIMLSVLGNAYSKMDKEHRVLLAQRLAFRIPIIQHFFIWVGNKDFQITDLMVGLSDETKKRRKSNVIDLIDFIIEGISNVNPEYRISLTET